MQAVFPDFIEPNLCDVRAQKRVNGTCPGLANTSLVAILAEDPQPFKKIPSHLYVPFR